MKDTTFVLARQTTLSLSLKGRGSHYVCLHGLLDLWHLPSDVLRVWLTVSRTPKRTAVRVDVSKDSWSQWHKFGKLPEYYVITSTDQDTVLNRFSAKGKHPVYLTLHYEPVDES